MMNNCKESIDLRGFDVGKKEWHPFRSISNFWKNKKVTDLVQHLAREALELFEDDSGKRYRFVSTVKAAWNLHCEYFITFTARQKDGPHVLRTIQAVVRHMDPMPYVMFCRIKPAVAHPPKPFRRPHPRRRRPTTQTIPSSSSSSS